MGIETGRWEIWIDDLDGELAMGKNDMARRKVEVVEKEALDNLVATMKCWLLRPSLSRDPITKAQIKALIGNYEN